MHRHDIGAIESPRAVRTFAHAVRQAVLSTFFAEYMTTFRENSVLEPVLANRTSG